MIFFISLDHPNAEPSFKFKIISFLLISINKHESWFQSAKDLILTFLDISNQILFSSFMHLYFFFNSLKILFHNGQ